MLTNRLISNPLVISCFRIVGLWLGFCMATLHSFVSLAHVPRVIQNLIPKSPQSAQTLTPNLQIFVDPVGWSTSGGEGRRNKDLRRRRAIGVASDVRLEVVANLTLDSPKWVFLRLFTIFFGVPFYFEVRRIYEIFLVIVRIEPTAAYRMNVRWKLLCMRPFTVRCSYNRTPEHWSWVERCGPAWPSPSLSYEHHTRNSRTYNNTDVRYVALLVLTLALFGTASASPFRPKKLEAIPNSVLFRPAFSEAGNHLTRGKAESRRGTAFHDINLSSIAFSVVNYLQLFVSFC